jgi:hypothetical protein
MDQDHEGLVLLLLREGSKRHAVELYREETGVSQREADEAVRDLAHRHGIALRRSKLLPVLLAGLAGLLGVLLSSA